MNVQTQLLNRFRSTSLGCKRARDRNFHPDSASCFGNSSASNLGLRAERRCLDDSRYAQRHRAL